MNSAPTPERAGREGLRACRRLAAPRRAPRALAWTLACAAALALSSPAAAGTPPPPPKRATPDYDGRGVAPTPPGDALLWVPRVVVSPLYFVSEFVLRRPLVTLLTEGERRHWADKVVRFFRFGPGETAVLHPTVVLDFGFRPNAGLVFTWRDIGARHHRLSLRAATGGRRWVSASASHAVPLRDGGALSMDVGLLIRPDYAYRGLAPAAPTALARYGRTTIEGGLTLSKTLGQRSSIATSTRVRQVRFHSPTRGCCGDPSLADLSAAPPPAYATGYLALEQHLALTLDTRPPRPEPGGGVELRPHATLGVDLRPTGPDRRNWLEYGGSVAASVDLSGHYRILTLQATALFVDPLDGTVPFTELADASTDGPLVAFAPGHLVGRSLAAVKLEYRWPIWLFLDGTLHLAVGGVFDQHLRDLDPAALRLSMGLGMRAASSGDIPFTLMLALGSEPLGDRFAIDSVRFVVGTTSGF